MPRRYEGMAYWEMISRQMGLISKREQLELKDSTVSVIGCGGIGGAVVEMLARMGVGKLIIIDRDVFDVSNINRQLMSSFHSLKLPKVDVAAERIRSINPFTDVEIYHEPFCEANAHEIIDGSDAVVDALDNITARVIASRECVDTGIPFIHGAIHGSMGQVTVFTTESPSYEELFHLPSAGMDLNEKVKKKLKKLSSEIPPVVGPVPNLTGCLQSFEVFKLITGRGNIIEAPRMLKFDLMLSEPFKIVELSGPKNI